MFRLSSCTRSLGFSLSSLFISPLLFLLILTGCSSDDVKIELTGQIDQSFSAGTKACLDTSGNGQCDSNEPSAQANSDGTYTITLPAESSSNFPIVVESASPSSNTPKKAVKLSAPAGKYNFVSPVSTAVQDKVYQGNSLADAETAVRSRYSLPDDIDLYADYQEDSVTPETAQVLMRVVEEVVADYGIEVEEEAADAEGTDETTASRRVVRNRVSTTSSTAETDNGGTETSSSDVADSVGFTSSTTVSADVAVTEEAGTTADEVQSKEVVASVVFASTEDAVDSNIAADSREVAVMSSETVYCPEIMFDQDGAQPASPGVLQPGESATFGWRVDVSNCDALDYRLVFAYYDTVGAGFDEGVGGSFSNTNPEFGLSKGENGLIYATMLAAPQNEGKFKVRFNIVDSEGNVLDIIGEQLYEIFEVQGTVTPAQPTTLLSPSNNATIDTTTPTLKWTSVDGATVYRVVLSEDSAFSGLNDDGSNTSCDSSCQTVTLSDVTYPVGSDLTVEFDKTYYWKVRDDASGQWSSVFQFTVSEEDDGGDDDDDPPSACWECSEREPLYAGPQYETPASGVGPDFVQTWGLVNNTSCPMENFTLGNPEVYQKVGTAYIPVSASVTGTYDTFSLAPNGGTAQVTANFHFEPPGSGVYYIFFDIITCDNEILPYLPDSIAPGYGRLYAKVGSGTVPCVAPAPAINSVDHVSLGNGKAVVSADVENVSDDPSLLTNDNESKLESGSNGNYNGGNEADKADSTNTIEVVGGCDQDAFLEYFYNTTRSDLLGSHCKTNSCGGWVGFIGDPVNTAIGNFIQQETDAAVAGPGDSTIRLQRTYNSQAVLWTPASKRRYFPDGSDEVVAEPPQYFGKGWTSELGQYLLEIDMAPAFEGVQILYADGHTANFKKTGDRYISDTPGNFNVITKEGDEFVLRDTDCQCAMESKRFDREGRLIALVDRNDNRINLIYDGDKLAAVENTAGRRVEFAVNGEGRITEARLPEDITLRYEYTDDMLTAFIDGRGNRTEYRYDDLGQMTGIISAEGHSVVRNSYDDEYRVNEQTVGESEMYSYSYADGQTTVTDSYGNAHVYHYDEDLRLVRTDYPDGTAEEYTYDENLNRTGHKNQAGSQWSWTYDDRGNRLTVDGPLGLHKEWEYSLRNLVTATTEKVDDSRERSFTFDYDDNGNLTAFCLPLGDCGSITYDAHGLPLEMTDLRGNTTTNVYDTEGDLISVTNPEGASTAFNHDDLGRIVGKTKPLGNSYSYTYDNNSNLIAVDGPLGFHIGYEYDADNNLITSLDPNGGAIKYAWTASDSIAAVTNQLGFTTSFAYGLMNERIARTDAEGREWSYTYDNMLRVTDVSGPLGYHQGFEYNALGRITDATDPENRVKHVDYDALGRPLTITRNYLPGAGEDADTNVTTAFTYDLLGNRLSVTDPEGYEFRAEYDLQNRLRTKQDAEGYEWEYSYDPMGNLLSVLNPRGYQTSYAYTPTNRLQSVTNPEAHTRTLAYNGNSKLTQVTDPMGTITSFAYNELDRRSEVVRNYQPAVAPDQQTNVSSKFEYDLAGNLRFVTNPLNHQAEIRYDAGHRRSEMIDFEGGTTRFEYDKVNNLLKVTDAEGNATSYSVDELDRLIAVTNAENETTGYAYDLVGNRTKLIEADDTVTLYEFDGVYRLNRVHENYRPGLDPGNDVNVLTAYSYDRRGLLTGIVNANGAETLFEHNGVGKLIKEIDPLHQVWEYAYDGNRNRISRRDAKGDLTEYSFYPDDMLEQISYADASTVAYQYDANNNRIGMSDTLGETSWAFDPLNRVTEQNDPFERVLGYQYDAASNRTGITYPDGNQVGYAYSPNNWLKTMTDPAGQAIEYSRDLVGNLTQIVNPNQTETTVAYDKVYRTLERINRQVTNGGKTNSGFRYTYNEVGHITEAIKEYGWRKPSVVTETYEYDGLHRLSYMNMSPIKNNGGMVETAYSYDPVGNRLSWESNDDLQTNTPFDGFYRSYEYNAANQMLAMENAADKKNDDFAYEYRFDANGNRINRQLIDRNGPQYGVDYSYDPENRLVLAQDYQIVGGSKKEAAHRIDRAFTTLEYDGGGRRLVQHYDPKQGGNGVDKRDEYVFDGLDPVAEYDMLNGQRTDYYRGAGNHLALMHQYKGGTQGQMYWYHYNNKGDVVGLTKHNGNSHHNYRYDPYGAVLPENGNFTDPHNHYTLTGKEFDENTGLVWFGARHYEPETGVWMGQDSYRGRLSEPGTLHRFSYLYNRPITSYDILGFISSEELKDAEYWMVRSYNQYREAENEFDIYSEDYTSFKIINYFRGVNEEEYSALQERLEWRKAMYNRHIANYEKLFSQYNEEKKILDQLNNGILICKDTGMLYYNETRNGNSSVVFQTEVATGCNTFDEKTIENGGCNYGGSSWCGTPAGHYTAGKWEKKEGRPEFGDWYLPLYEDGNKTARGIHGTFSYLKDLPVPRKENIFYGKTLFTGWPPPNDNSTRIPYLLCSHGCTRMTNNKINYFHDVLRSPYGTLIDVKDTCN
ncbi:MAG: RHS repeat-associated core domain-containing protein [Candidatus Electrothrix scaldis]|nr:MAG: RHS repeat-associated core domain-containing protein [Candidatus Electrothrix sp. GW3-3]